MEKKELSKNEIEELMKEIVSLAKNSFNSEESNLVGEVKGSHKEIKSELQNITKRLDTANGYTAKHEQRLNTQDVLNAQITLTQAQTTASLEKISQKLEELSVAKSEAEGSLNTFKWLFGALGVGNIIMFLKTLF